MRKKKLLFVILCVILAIIISVSIYAYVVENATISSLGTGFSAIMAIIIFILQKNNNGKDKAENKPCNFQNKQAIIINSIDCNKLVKEIQELEELYQASSDENKLKIAGMLLEKRQELELLKESIYHLNESFSKISLNTKRLQQAKICFDAGKFREADALLNAKEIASEVEQLQVARRKKEQELDKIDTDLKDKSNEYLIKAQIWATLYSEPNWYDETIKYYEKALDTALTVEALFQYATFLHTHNQLSEAVILYEEVLQFYKSITVIKTQADLVYEALIFSMLGEIYRCTNKHTKALEANEEAFKIYGDLVADDPQMYLPCVAITLTTFGNLFLNMNEYLKAQEKYDEALKIYSDLVTDDPQMYLPCLALTLNNLGLLHYATNEYPKALDEYSKALEIYRNLVATDPKEHLPCLANILNSLGVLHYAINEHSKALKEYEEALKIYRDLVSNSTKVYGTDVAMTLNNLKILHGAISKYPNTCDEYVEAFEIFKDYVADNPKAYLRDVAMTLNSLGVLHSENGEHTKALEEHEESLNIYRYLVYDNPKAYLPYVAIILDSLGRVYSNINEYSKALKKHEEATKIYKSLVADNPKAYLPYLSQNYGHLSWNYLFTKEYSEAEYYAFKALELSRMSDVKNCLAHALLLQNRFLEAENIYKELLQTIIKNDEIYTQTLLEDFDKLEKANVIPENCKAEVEKIRKMLKK